MLNFFVVGEALTTMKAAGFALAALGVYLGTRSASNGRTADTSQSVA